MFYKVIIVSTLLGIFLTNTFQKVKISWYYKYYKIADITQQFLLDPQGQKIWVSGLLNRASLMPNSKYGSCCIVPNEYISNLTSISILHNETSILLYPCFRWDYRKHENTRKYSHSCTACHWIIIPLHVFWQLHNNSFICQ